jgi:hypothetical protein
MAQNELVAAGVVVLSILGAFALVRLMVGIMRRMLMVVVLGLVCAAFVFYGGIITGQADSIMQKYQNPERPLNGINMPGVGRSVLSLAKQFFL